MRLLGLAGWAIVASVVSIAAGARAASPDATAPRADADEAARSRGALLFEIHCSSCHGPEGRGDGPLAGDLKAAPADLTDLVEADEMGKSGFPASWLRAVIDGRDEVAGHGGREMPVWGLTFRETGRDADQEELVAGRVDDLIEYLRALQTADLEDPEEPPNAD